MNCLITGGCGFVGSTLVRHLVSNTNYAVRILDDLSTGTRQNLETLIVPLADRGAWTSRKVGLWIGDILDIQIVNSAIIGADVVVHLAANTGVPISVENPIHDCQANIIGTLNILESSREAKIRRFIFASSNAPVGNSPPPIHENLVPKPVSPYGVSKLTGESYCNAYYHSYGLETVALRFSNIFGPGSESKLSVVSRFIRQAINGDQIVIYGTGEQSRDFIFSEDVATAILCAINAPQVGGEVFQIGSGVECSLNEFVSILLSLLNQHNIAPPHVTYVKERVGDIFRNYSDATKAKKVLGWQTKTILEDGLSQTIESFKRTLL